MYYLIGFAAKSDKGEMINSFVVKSDIYPSYFQLVENAKVILDVHKFQFFIVLAISKMTYQEYLNYQGSIIKGIKEAKKEPEKPELKIIKRK
jgi:hypothetical protein